MDIKLPENTSLVFREMEEGVDFIYTFFTASGKPHEVSFLGTIRHLCTVGSGHRLLDRYGRSHYMPSTWLHLKMSPDEFLECSMEEGSPLYGENSRTYTFVNDEGIECKVTINRVEKLLVTDTHHLLLDEEGYFHLVPMGWVHLSWVVDEKGYHFSR